jgi:Arc/MetJ family transcription regulator
MELSIMRTTIVLDDDLLASASTISGITERSALLREALQALISREAANRLAALGGALPQISAVARRQFGEDGAPFDFAKPNEA